MRSAAVSKLSPTAPQGAGASGSAHEARETREVMDIRQAAQYLGISADSLYRYASDNFIPAFKLGNRWRFKKSRLDAWMDQQSGLEPEPVKRPKVTQKKPVRASR